MPLLSLESLKVEFDLFLVRSLQRFFDLQGLTIELELLVLHQCPYLLGKHAPICFQLVKVDGQTTAKVCMLNLAPLQVGKVHRGNRQEKVVILVLIRYKLTSFLNDWLCNKFRVLQQLLQVVELCLLVCYSLLECLVSFLIDLQSLQDFGHINICVIVYFAKNVCRGRLLWTIEHVIKVTRLLYFGRLECFISRFHYQGWLFIFDEEIDNISIEVAKAEHFLINMLLS